MVGDGSDNNQRQNSGDWNWRESSELRCDDDSIG